MAAISAVAVAVSPSLSSLKSFCSKNDSFFVKLPSTTARISLPSSSSSLSQYPLPLAAPSRKWRGQRVTAAVEQEEAGVTAPVEVEKEGEEAAPAAAEEVEKEEEAAPAAAAEEVPGAGEAALKTKLYFGNLPYSIDSSQLAGIIQEYANPELVEVLYDRETGRSRGYAFVTMSSIEDCNAVIDNLDGREHMGRTLRVNLADKPRSREEPLYPQTEHKLFVGNLSWSVTTESLTQAFQAHGNVVGARVLYDGETGKARGFGFVCFATRLEMEAALEALDGVELEGRAMRVSIATGRRQ